MAKVTLKEFADWLGLEPKDIQLAREIVDVSDPDGAYTHLQDDEDTINESIKNNKIKTKKITLLELKRLVGKIIKEEMENQKDDLVDFDVPD